jgi:hypothetical protein
MSNLSTNLLSLPYRDRQLIGVVRDADDTLQPVEIKLGDYYSVDAYLRGLNPKSWFTKDYWTNTKNYGLVGYFIDKAKGAEKSTDNQSLRYLRKVKADQVEGMLQFPPGHPLYETVYAGHPLLPSVYIPLARFHRFLFEEKLTELLMVLWSLGAKKVTITHEYGYGNEFNASGGLTIPVELPVEAGTSFKRKTSQSSTGTIEAYFQPVATPLIPTSVVWYTYEPTWKRVAEARLSAGLTEIDVELRYDDDFGVSADVALQLTNCGFKVGGEFQKHEHTSWKFKSSFN